MKSKRQFVVTGASRGIGLELVSQALGATGEGNSVFALARDPASSPGLQSLLKKYPDSLRVFACDVTSEADTRRAAQELGAETVVDVLINNAGAYLDSDEDFEELSMERVLESLAVNSVSPMRVTRAFLPLLKRSKSAKLANITSLMGSIDDNTSGGSYGYRMSKTALNMFTRSFSRDYPSIVALTIHPGWVRTRMGGESAPTEADESARGILKVIAGATGKESGRFYDFEGDELPW
jgi:NAD(P)-dependent dehydrogenase (short-subunit alcohol dehydrogenase family)